MESHNEFDILCVYASLEEKQFIERLANEELLQREQDDAAALGLHRFDEAGAFEVAGETENRWRLVGGHARGLFARTMMCARDLQSG